MRNRLVIIGLVLAMIVALMIYVIKDKEDGGDSIEFKREYESLNDKTDSNGNGYRSISIDDENPFIYISAEELVEKLDAGETFYVYFGSKFCPWCRSVIESAVKVAKEKGISKIYYVDIWDDEKNEILRDKYIIDSNSEPKLLIEGTDVYYEILDRFDNVLSDYTLEDEEGKVIDVGEKRIYAPNFVYVEDGISKILVKGTSDKQIGSRDKLTDEILKDQVEIFREFFDEG